MTTIAVKGERKKKKKKETKVVEMAFKFRNPNIGLSSCRLSDVGPRLSNVPVTFGAHSSIFKIKIYRTLA